MAALVVIPVLAAAQASERLLRPLAGASSLDRTLRAALDDLPEAEVVVTTDDPAIADRARSVDRRVRVHDREVAAYVPALAAVADRYPADLVAVLEPTHPFRPPGLVRRTLANLAGRDDLDSVVCVRRFRASLWRREADGTIQALSGGGAGREGEYYQELAGLALATRPGLLRAGRRVGDAVGFEVVDRFWALADIRDEVSLAMAGLVAGHYGDFMPPADGQGGQGA